MTHKLLLDRLIGAHWPDLGSDDSLRAFEATPYAERSAARSTYEALRIGAAHDPAAAALEYLPAADPGAGALGISYASFIGRVTQTANLLTGLGVGPNDVVSFLLPLVPQSFFTLFGAEAVGIANPVNPLLEPARIAESLRAANTKVLVALGPAPGSDIWDKVQAIGDQLPNIKAIVVVRGGGELPAGAHDFDALADACPADRLVGARVIQADDPAAYFHTGGTTGTPKLVRHSHGNQVTRKCFSLLAGATAVQLDNSSFFELGGVALRMRASVLRAACAALRFNPPSRRCAGSPGPSA